MDEAFAVKEILAELSDGETAPDSIRAGMSLADDLGIGSLQLLLLVVELERKLGRQIFSAESVAELSTVGDVLNALELTVESGPRVGAAS